MDANTFKVIKVLYENHKDLLKEFSEESIVHLASLCDTENKLELINSLLKRFDYIQNDVYCLMLASMAKHIVATYNPCETVIASITMDQESDSSDRVLNDMIIPLQKADYNMEFLMTKNRFSAIQNAGRINAVIVDEFIGTGTTVKNRLKSVNGWRNQNINLEFCFLAGMEDGIEFAKRHGAKVFCAWKMKKAISDYFDSSKLNDMVQAMQEMESTLASQVNQTSLTDYHFGYGRAESIFCYKEHNIPNNVFPLFWWKKDVNDKQIKPLFTRHQHGF